MKSRHDFYARSGVLKFGLADQSPLVIGGTQDGCEHWSQISDFTTEVDALPTQTLCDIGISKTDPDFMYAGFYNPTWNGETAEIIDTVRLVRTKNGGTSWEDITGLVNYDWAGISDILVSPVDSSRFWITLWQRNAT